MDHRHTYKSFQDVILMNGTTGAGMHMVLCIGVSLLMIIPVSMSRTGKEGMHGTSPLGYNLVPNPSFENGSSGPDGWQHNFVCGDGEYLWDSRYVHDGKKSVGISNIDRKCNVDTYYWNMRGYIEVDPAHSYNLSVWYFYSRTPGTWPRACAILWYYDESKTYISMRDMPCNATEKGWHRFTAEDIDIPDGTAYVKVVLGAHAYSDELTPVEIRFDEVYFGVTTHDTENNPPKAPAITGPTSGKTGVEYTYTFVSTDPEGDEVYYWVEWGDDCPVEEWIGPYASGDTVSFTHTWDTRGTYLVKAMARDTHNAESEWATLEVSIPKAYERYTLFERLVCTLQHLTGHPLEKLQWLWHTGM